MIDKLSAQNSPLRIALLGYRSSPFSGGQGIYLRYLSKGLLTLGHDVTVISGPPYPELIKGVRLVELPSLDLYARDLWSIKMRELVGRLERREWISKATGGFAEPWAFGERARDWLLPRLAEFDIIHDNQTLAPGILDLQATGIPVLTTIHHPITRDLRTALEADSRWWSRIFIRRWHSFLSMQAKVSKKLDRIVTVSSISARDIVADFGVLPSILRVIPNGVDTQLFRPHPSIARHPRRLIATASADSPMKGLPTLLSAIKLLSNEFPDIELVLIAKRNRRGETEKLIQRLQLDNRIHFKGGATHEEIVKLYAQSTVAIVPSLYEGFGLPALEAMAAGIPLISSDGGALREVVGDGGLLVRAGDERALASAISDVLTFPEVAKSLSKRGLKRVEERYSWLSCAKEMERLYYESILDC